MRHRAPVLRWATPLLGVVVTAALFSTPALAAGAGVIVFDRCQPGSLPSGICSIQPDGRGLRQLTHSGEGNPTVSSKGELAFECGDTFSGGLCVRGPRRIRQVTRYGNDPVWSPSGAELLFEDCTQGHIAGGLCTVNVETDKVHRLTGNGAEAWPAWSPNGRQIAFAIEESDDPAAGIWVMNSRGGGARHLYAGQATGPAWSPNSAQIAYTQLFNGVYVINANGTRNHQLVADGEAQEPWWSPNGKRIVYSNGTLQVVWAQGGSPHTLSKVYGLDPVWAARLG